MSISSRNVKLDALLVNRPRTPIAFNVCDTPEFHRIHEKLRDYAATKGITLEALPERFPQLARVNETIEKYKRLAAQRSWPIFGSQL
jgi:hypothetical protein